MICGFCGSRNSNGEHRCRRCGRRPEDTLTGDYTLHRTEGQLAVQMQPEAVAVAEPPRRPSIGRAIQVPLFQDRPASNVIPFESYAPVEPKPRQRSTGTGTRRPRRPVPEEQGTLDFLPAAPPKPRTLGTTVEAVIFCDAPVASRPHRMIAAALDWSMVTIAYGLFLAVYRLMGGDFVLTKGNVALLGAVLPLFGVLYGLMWAWAGKESLGMQWAKLHLLTFDGFPPDRKQRLMRLAGSTLSLVTGCLGLLWSLVDEESLGWQDHMSRTFPTPVGLDELVLRRR
jgi:uncharacterized RDD family membrane protein YckC